LREAELTHRVRFLKSCRPFTDIESGVFHRRSSSSHGSAVAKSTGAKTGFDRTPQMIFGRGTRLTNSSHNGFFVGLTCNMSLDVADRETGKTCQAPQPEIPAPILKIRVAYQLCSSRYNQYSE
jgi:hypothetical protein